MRWQERLCPDPSLVGILRSRRTNRCSPSIFLDYVRVFSKVGALNGCTVLILRISQWRRLVRIWVIHLIMTGTFD